MAKSLSTVTILTMNLITTCSTKMMKWTISTKICFLMTMIKRYRCYKRWKIKRQRLCKSSIRKKLPAPSLKAKLRTFLVSQITIQLGRIRVRLISISRRERHIRLSSRTKLPPRRWVLHQLNPLRLLPSNQSMALLSAKISTTVKRLLSRWWTHQLP